MHKLGDSFGGLYAQPMRVKIFCKIAGLVTEANWKNWNVSDFTSYISVVLDIFGIERVMFGSDWPVCLPSASYSQVCEILNKNTSFLSLEEKEKLLEARQRDHCLFGLNSNNFL